MDKIEKLEAIVRRTRLPDWIRSVRVELGEDHYGDPAADVHFLVREGREDVLENGRELNRCHDLIVEAFYAADAGIFPYVFFHTAAEAA